MARFANAVASLDVAPNALAGEVGIDVLSFGGTKNGLAFGEAVVFFPQGDGEAARRGLRDSHICGNRRGICSANTGL